MRLTPRSVTTATLLCLAGMGAWLLALGAGDGGAGESSPVVRALRNAERGVEGEPPRLLPGTTEPAPAVPDDVFAAIRQRLHDTDRQAWDTGWAGQDYEAVVEETVDQVSFPDGILEILTCARAETMKFAPSLIEKSVRARLAAPGNVDWRHRLAVWVPRDADAIAAVWGWYAHIGKTCPPGEYDILSAATRDPGMRDFLKLGRNETLVLTAPVEAVASTLELMRQQLISNTAFDYLPALMKKLPPGTDFDAIERLLPSGDWRYDSTRAALNERRGGGDKQEKSPEKEQ